MASFRSVVRDYQDELRNGIAWVAFWREGRSWEADYFYMDPDDYLEPEDKIRLEEILKKDPSAVILNSYYCGQLAEDMTVDELAAGVRHHYENGYNKIGEFIEAHNDRLPPEEIEKGKAAAHAAGLSFSEKYYKSEEGEDLYSYDGGMSIEDVEHRLKRMEEGKKR